MDMLDFFVFSEDKRKTMKLLFVLLVASMVFVGCENQKEMSSINPVNWEKRTLRSTTPDSLLRKGSTYLSVYSEIYSESEHATIDLTATVSLRNINQKDTIFIHKATYFNTHGEAIRNYFSKPIFIAPLETIEIIIDEKDKEGGSGANFIFDWSVSKGLHEPYFEAVMISTYGQQGISFTTRGIQIN